MVSFSTGEIFRCIRRKVSARVCRRLIRLLERRGMANADGLIPEEKHKPAHGVQEAAARVVALFARVDEQGRVHPVYERSAYARAGEFRGRVGCTRLKVAPTAG